jgi:hypothetical protein
MSQGRDAQKIKHEIFFHIQRALGGAVAYARLDERGRQRMKRATDNIYDLLTAEGFRPDATAMTHERFPAQHVVERNEITFWESEYPALFIEPQPYDVTLAPHVIAWLDARAPGWSVTFDRGDFGEGTPKAVLNLPAQRQALAFMEEFGKRPSQPLADGSNLEDDSLYEDVPLKELGPPAAETVELSPSSITVEPQDGQGDGG